MSAFDHKFAYELYELTLRCISGGSLAAVILLVFDEPTLSVNCHVRFRIRLVVAGVT
jgi:hypothetical protein